MQIHPLLDRPREPGEAKRTVIETAPRLLGADHARPYHFARYPRDSVAEVYAVLLVRLHFRDDDVARALATIIASGGARNTVQCGVRVAVPVLEARGISFDVPD